MRKIILLIISSLLILGLITACSTIKETKKITNKVDKYNCERTRYQRNCIYSTDFKG